MLRKVQEENLRDYEANKDEYKNWRQMSDEELKSRLFAKKFCFLLKIEKLVDINNSYIVPNKSMIKLITLSLISTFARKNLKSFASKLFFKHSVFFLSSNNSLLICSSQSMEQEIDRHKPP